MAANVFVQRPGGVITIIATNPDDDTAGFDIYYDSSWSDGTRVRTDRQYLHIANAAAMPILLIENFIAAASTAVNA
jgi:hypothetical protein